MQESRGKENNIKDYFIQGFSLLNRNIDLYFLALLFTLISFLIQHLYKLHLPIGFIITILSLVITVLSVSYSLTIPYFLSYKQIGKKLDYGFLWRTILHNAKRLILPIIVLTLIAVIAFIVIGIGIIVVVPLHVKNPQDFVRFLTQQGWIPWYVLFTTIFAVIFSFFTFTSIFFSVENLGIFNAWIKSIAFSFKNIEFVVLIMAISVMADFITSFTSLIPFDRTFTTYLALIPTQYIHLGILASSLLFYQDRKKQH